MTISKKDLELIKKEVSLDLQKLVEKIDVDQLATFNKGYLSYRNKPYQKFVQNELDAWTRIIDFYAFRRGNDCRGILDIGTFIPFYPAVLKKMGYQVEVIEKVSLYGEAYKPISEYLNSQEIRMHDIDIISESIDSLPRGFDFLLIAILEHLNGSPKNLIEKIKSLMDTNSLLYIHVPNICKLPNVISIVRGKSPLPSYQDYYFSGYPFEGHNREMTLEELSMLCEFSSLEIVEKGRVIKANASLSRVRRIYNIIEKIAPNYSDSVYVICKKKR